MQKRREHFFFLRKKKGTNYYTHTYILIYLFIPHCIDRKYDISICNRTHPSSTTIIKSKNNEYNFSFHANNVLLPLNFNLQTSSYFTQLIVLLPNTPPTKISVVAALYFSTYNLGNLRKDM